MKEAISANFCRLSAPPYTIDEVFRPESYDWPGDWEGRALLAFCCHYRLTGKKIPCMDALVAALPSKTGEKGYFGKPFDPEYVDEQQLSGNSWLLRGLLAYAELFGGKAAEYAVRVAENLFLPALSRYESYPERRPSAAEGGVSGNAARRTGNWLVSTDVGCAFLALDGVAHYYAASGDERFRPLLFAAAERFMRLDKTALRMQTHAALTAGRALLVLYAATKEKRLLEGAKRLFSLYREKGMTLTYENFNWFGREDTWTEPCAVVDSLILSCGLYRVTGDSAYKTAARRIWLNGLQFCQRPNGGAGPNACVTERQPFLKISLYEAPFCCTMRYAEGLLCRRENADLFTEPETGGVHREGNRFFAGDRLLCEDINGVFPRARVYRADGKKLIAVPSLRGCTEEQAANALLRVVF